MSNKNTSNQDIPEDEIVGYEDEEIELQGDFSTGVRIRYKALEVTDRELSAMLKGRMDEPDNPKRKAKLQTEIERVMSMDQMLHGFTGVPANQLRMVPSENNPAVFEVLLEEELVMEIERIDKETSIIRVSKEAPAVQIVQRFAEENAQFVVHPKKETKRGKNKRLKAPRKPDGTLGGMLAGEF